MSNYQDNYDAAEEAIESWSHNSNPDPESLMLAQVRATLALAEAVIETGVVLLRASRGQT